MPTPLRCFAYWKSTYSRGLCCRDNRMYCENIPARLLFLSFSLCIRTSSADNMFQNGLYYWKKRILFFNYPYFTLSLVIYGLIFIFSFYHNSLFIIINITLLRFEMFQHGLYYWKRKKVSTKNWQKPNYFKRILGCQF